MAVPADRAPLGLFPGNLVQEMLGARLLAQRLHPLDLASPLLTLRARRAVRRSGAHVGFDESW
jgi:hypothetical protein